jgi:hypothetical protein
LSAGPETYGVEVSGGIWSEIDTSGLSEIDAILDAAMLLYTVYIALARED